MAVRLYVFRSHIPYFFGEFFCCRAYIFYRFLYYYFYNLTNKRLMQTWTFFSLWLTGVLLQWPSFIGTTGVDGVPSAQPWPLFEGEAGRCDLQQHKIPFGHRTAPKSAHKQKKIFFKHLSNNELLLVVVSQREVLICLAGCPPLKKL